MSALDTLFLIVNNESLNSYDFRYCLVDNHKLPYKPDKTLAKPNHTEDFIKLSSLVDTSLDVLTNYYGIGVSIQASDVCAIDIDHCVDNKFDINSINKQAKDIIDIFKEFAYVEFSFSGTGIRIFFKAHKIDNYEHLYYTKNSKVNIEYYYPEGSARYVTITGQTIHNNKIQSLNISQQSKLVSFLDTYMKRHIPLNTVSTETFNDDRPLEKLMQTVKYKYMTDMIFQNLWFSQAPGSGFDESERDYHLIAYLYENITKDKDKLKQIFEQSPFYKSKDYKHLTKWQKQNYRYFNYVYGRIKELNK